MPNKKKPSPLFLPEWYWSKLSLFFYHVYYYRSTYQVPGIKEMERHWLLVDNGTRYWLILIVVQGNDFILDMVIVMVQVLLLLVVVLAVPGGSSRASSCRSL